MPATTTRSEKRNVSRSQSSEITYRIFIYAYNTLTNKLLISSCNGLWLGLGLGEFVSVTRTLEYVLCRVYTSRPMIALVTSAFINV